MFKLGKRPLPMIGRLSELLVSGHRAAGFFDATTTSPRSPLDLKMGSSSPRGLKNYDLGGVGLGIVAALEKSTHSGREILAKYAVCSQNLNRSDPIPVTSVHNRDGFSMGIQEFEDSMDENYTYVTCHGRNNGSVTKVYYDGGDLRRSSTGPNHGADLGACNNSNLGRGPVESVVFPTSDFLSSCHMCRKKLDGKDIYMYRGEKAFCSTECRAAQILMDERKEQCRLETSRSGDVASSSYSRDQIFFSAGILAI